MKKILIFAGILSLIFVDNVVAQDTLILQPGPEGKDSFLDDWYTEPHGDYPNLFALAGTSNGIPCLMRSIMEFDVSTIPEGAVLLDARLSLYFANNPSVPHYQYGDNVALLQRVIEPWDEATVNWFNQPEVTEQNQVVLPASTDPEQDYVDIDVRDIFQDIVDNPENSHGLLFRLQTEVMYRRMFFASSDYDDPAKWPRLVIIYTDCQAPVSDFTYTSDEFNAYFQDSSMFAEDYYWDFGDGYYSDLVNPWHQYAAEGTYEVCLTVSNSCWSDTECKWVEICEKPETAFTYQIEAMTAYFEDQSYKAESYYWDFGDGYYSDLADPFHIYDYPGSYEVCLITWNECGSDTLCQVLDVMSKSYSKGNAGVLSVYPNPGKEKVFIKATADGQAEIGLYDLNGNEISKQQYTLVKDEQVSVDIQALEPGMYMIRLISGEGSSFGKLVVL